MKNLLTIFLLLTCGVCLGQNLVPNPSFEDTVSCPTHDGQMNRAVGWAMTRSSSDYFNSCATMSNKVSIPSNIFGFQYAATGNAYAGFWAKEGTSIYKEHLGASLISNLQIGIRYFVSLKVNLSPYPLEGNYCGINKLGVLFSTINYGIFYPSPVNNYAQVYSDSIITDTLNWVTIKGSFVADSNYSFITIGSFFDDSFIDSFQVAGNLCRAYYYVDDVCVSTDSMTCNTTVGIQQTNGNTDVSLFPNPFSTQLTFSLSDNEQTTVSLYDFLGQQVLQQTFTNSTTINTEQMRDGIYFYELRSNKGTLKTGKLVKQ